MNEKLTAPVWVARTEEVERLSEKLRNQAIVAVDTESNSLFAYREQVCLVQFSTPEADFLVDPLARADLSALGRVFCDPGVEKVFHAAEYDVICLRRDFGFEFTNLFDTMVACRILGREAVGLGALLLEEFGMQVDKRGQRANWGQRPLPRELLDYARLDTHYLIPLRERLQQKLVERGLLELAQEDFRRLAQSQAAENGRNGAAEGVLDCWRVSGAYDLAPQQVAVLQELCRYRDQIARQYNRPLFKVFGDKTLTMIATTMPRSLEELGRLPGMTSRQVQRHGPGLLQAVQRGRQAAPLYPPRSPRPNEAFLERLEALKQWRKAKGQQMSVPSDVILPRDLMFALANKGPADPEALGEILKETPWRLSQFGEEILRLTKRERA